MIVIEWKPLETLTDKMVFQGMHYDVEGFRVLLSNTDEAADVYRFSFAPLCYRVLDESDYLKTSSGFSGKTLSIMRNSEYLKWFVEECCGTYSLEEIVHYGLYTDGECIDVITKYTPEVKKAVWG